jgi:hypothetical protein
MASTINASTNLTSGLVYNADASGVLQLQSNGVTGLTVGTGGVVTAANGIVMNTMTLGSPITGEFEYDGRVPYFTPAGTQRGVVPGMQYYRLNTAVVGANTTGAQNLLGVGVTLSSNTVYAFESNYNLTKAAGTTAHTFSFLFGGTAAIGSIAYTIMRTSSGVSFTDTAGAVQPFIFAQTVSATTVTGSRTLAVYYDQTVIKGTVSVITGGTFIPQYTLSAAPGGAYTTQPGSYFAIYPVGTAGSNTSVGTWA